MKAGERGRCSHEAHVLTRPRRPQRQWSRGRGTASRALNVSLLLFSACRFSSFLVVFFSTGRPRGGPRGGAPGCPGAALGGAGPAPGQRGGVRGRGAARGGLQPCGAQYCCVCVCVLRAFPFYILQRRSLPALWAQLGLRFFFLILAFVTRRRPPSSRPTAVCSWRPWPLPALALPSSGARQASGPMTRCVVAWPQR